MSLVKHMFSMTVILFNYWIHGLIVMTQWPLSLDISLHNWALFVLKSMRLYGFFGNSFIFIMHHKGKSHRLNSGLRVLPKVPTVVMLGILI